MPQTDKFLSYIGISKKAGRIVTGTELTCEAIRNGKIKLAILASDASANTEKRLRNCCEYYGVRFAKCGFTAETLGRAVGSRGSVASVGLTDEGLAEAAVKSIQKQ